LIDPPQIEPFFIREHVGGQGKACGLKLADVQQFSCVGMDLPGRNFRAVLACPFQAGFSAFFQTLFKLVFIADFPF
jgi:hypothetical protein